MEIVSAEIIVQVRKVILTLILLLERRFLLPD